MNRMGVARIGLAAALVAILAVGVVMVTRTTSGSQKHFTGYFANSTGLFVGDEVKILGVPVGKVDRIEPEAERVKIEFWVNDKYQIPANANAVIIAPSLVSTRAIQLTPVYADGPELQTGAVIPEERTAVPVEWDDFRSQLQRLTETLQPNQPGGVSSLGALVNTAADNLRGEGANIRATIIKISQTFSALGDHSADLFGTVKSLSSLVSALEDSTDLMRGLNQNLAAVTGLLSNSPNEIGAAVDNLNTVIGDVKDFVSENRETVGTASDRLASITTALNQSLDDLKQTLHAAPTQFQNFVNIYQPAQGALTGALSLTNFSNPITFICGAIQAASRLGAEQSAKLCAQYLAPIIKNRQYNFPPLGENLFVGASARPNEITYSEEWMRPDYIPPSGGPAPAAPPPGEPASAGPAEVPAPGAPVPSGPLLPAEAIPQPTEPRPANPADGLQGLMTPPGGGGS